MALARVFNDAILDVIDGVAGAERGCLDGGQLGWRNVVGGRIECGQNIPGGVGQKVSPVIGRRACEDAVIVGRIALRFHKGLAAAVGTRIEIGPARGVAVEVFDDGFGGDGGFVNGAIAEVDDLFGMVKRPAGVGDAAFVSGIRRGGSVVMLHGVGEFVEVDFSGEAAVADALEFSIPASGGQPDFEANIGILGGLDGACDPAEGGQILDGARSGRGEIAGGTEFGGGDGGVRNREGREAFASGGGEERGGK